MFKLWRQAMAIAVIVVGAFIHAAPTCAASITLSWPVQGPITSTFSAFHPAIDIYVPNGTPVKAAAGGTVVWSGWKNNGGGNVVDVDHGAGALTSYDHLSAVSVTVGQWVNGGQRVGFSGMTGMATGPHLHFAVSIGGIWQNPLSFLPTLAVSGRVPNTAMSC